MSHIDIIEPDEIIVPKSKNLTDMERHAVYDSMLTMLRKGRPAQGAFSKVAAQYNVHPKTVSRIWHRGRSSLEAGAIVADVSSKRKGSCGPKSKMNDINFALTALPLNRRGSLRSISAATGIPITTLHRQLKAGSIRRHSSTIKPLLTDTNKKDRLKYCLSMIFDPKFPDQLPKFQDMLDCIHVDEKWFYLTKANRKYYLALSEPDPVRFCKSKQSITKVMFLAAVARPRFNKNRNQYFDGKIGIWPFVIKEPAKKNSKNRAKGTLLTKSIIVTKEEYRKMIIENVLPAIEDKWPRGAFAPKKIFVQQDNAKPHIGISDSMFVEAAGKLKEFQVQIRSQPPNSPDFNVLDLGFFNSIQSLQYQEAPKSIEDLIQAVEKSFYDLDLCKLNNVYLTLQQCMIACMEQGGGNNYKIPHIGKEKLVRRGELQRSFNCDIELIERTKQFLMY